MNHAASALTLALGVMVLAGCATTPVGAPQTSQNQLAEQYVQLGVGYMQEGNYELALTRLRRALAVDPKSAQAYNMLGLLYEVLGQNEEAEKHFRTAVRLNPEFSSARNNYGSFLCKTGKTKAAEAEFQSAVKNPLYDRPEIAYANAGLCMQRAGDMDNAERYFRDALQRNPRMPIALLHMAQVKYEGEQYLPARAYIQRYQEVSPGTAESLWLGFRIEQALGDRNAASSYAMRLEADFPDSQEVRLLQRKRAR